MGLDIFFADDIRRALLAADEASLSTARVCAATGGDPATVRAYLEGYRAALATVALAFGLSPAILDSRVVVVGIDDEAVALEVAAKMIERGRGQ